MMSDILRCFPELLHSVDILFLQKQDRFCRRFQIIHLRPPLISCAFSGGQFLLNVNGKIQRAPVILRFTAFNRMSSFASQCCFQIFNGIAFSERAEAQKRPLSLPRRDGCFPSLYSNPASTRSRISSSKSFGFFRSARSIASRISSRLAGASGITCPLCSLLVWPRLDHGFPMLQTDHIAEPLHRQTGTPEIPEFVQAVQGRGII